MRTVLFFNNFLNMSSEVVNFVTLSITNEKLDQHTSIIWRAGISIESNPIDLTVSN